MLYKPKNMYPRLNSDQPIIYLDQIPEDGTVDFTFNIDGNEKLKDIQGTLYYSNLAEFSEVENFNLAITDLPKYNIGSAVSTSVGQTPYRPVTPFILTAVYDYAYYSRPNEKQTYNDRAKLGDTAWTSTTNRTGFSWQGNTVAQYFMAGSNVHTNGSFSVYDKSNIAKQGNIDVNLYLTYFLGLRLSEEQKQLLNFGNWGLIVNDDYDIVYRSVKTYKSYCSMQITNNKQIDLDANSSNIEILIDKYNVGQPLCKFTVTLSKLLLGHMQFGTDCSDYFIDTNSESIDKHSIPVTIVCTISKINKTDTGTEVICTCGVESINLENSIDFSSGNPMIICGNISAISFVLNKNNNLVSVSIAPNNLSINAFFHPLHIMGDGKSNAQIKWDGIQNQSTSDISSIVLSSWYLYPTKDKISVKNLPYQNLDMYLKDNLPIKYKVSKKDLPKDTQGNVSINSQDICQYSYRINNLYFSGEQFKIQTSGVPQINISIDQVACKINAFGTFNSTSLQEKIKNYQWKLYRGTYNEDTDQINGKLVYQTPETYSQDFQFEYNNLIPGDYIIEGIVEDNYGQIWFSRKTFQVSHNQNDLFLNLQSELDKENTGIKLKWDRSEYGIAKVYTCGNILDNYSYQESNKYTINNSTNLIPAEVTNSMYGYFALKINNLNLNLDKIKYIECLGNFKPRYSKTIGKQLTYNFLNTNLYLRVNSYNWRRKQLTQDQDLWRLTIQYDIDLQYNNKIISEFSLGGHISWEGKRADLPSSLLEFGDLRSEIINMFTISAFQIDLDKKLLRLLINDKIVEIQDITINSFKNLELNNCTQLHYLIASKESKIKDNFDFPPKRELDDWDSGNYDCLLTFSNENNPLGYRDPDITIEFDSWNIKRYNPLTQKVLDMGQYYFAEEDIRFIDYSLPHNEEIKYLIYPQGSKRITDGTTQAQIFSPVYSDLIKGDWDKWCLFTTRGPAPKNRDGTADKGYNENVLLVDKVFFFEMNVETGSMKNNTDFSIIKNFTPYPHVQRSPSNYWSGQLKGLLGRLAIDDCTFKQTPTMLQEIKELTQNTSRKFLKDRDGNFWEIELSSDITIDNNDKLDVQLKTKSFNWVEVGDASDIALVSVGPGREDWLLTELGYEKIDTYHTWDDSAIWDDNDFWTESE